MIDAHARRPRTGSRRACRSSCCAARSAAPPARAQRLRRRPGASANARRIRARRRRARRAASMRVRRRDMAGLAAVRRAGERQFLVAEAEAVGRARFDQRQRLQRLDGRARKDRPLDVAERQHRAAVGIDHRDARRGGGSRPAPPRKTSTRTGLPIGLMLPADQCDLPQFRLERIYIAIAMYADPMQDPRPCTSRVASPSCSHSSPCSCSRSPRAPRCSRSRTGRAAGATADWSSIGSLPPATRQSARRGFSSCPAAPAAGRASSPSIAGSCSSARTRAPGRRYDVVGWGNPVRINGWAPDGRWYGDDPGRRRRHARRRGRGADPEDRGGDQGLSATPMPATTACGRVRTATPSSRPCCARSRSSASRCRRTRSARISAPGPMPAWTDSRTGVEASLWGLLGVKLGWVEGIELNFLGLVAGLDLRHPALKLPGFGRIGIDSSGHAPATAAPISASVTRIAAASPSRVMTRARGRARRAQRLGDETPHARHLAAARADSVSGDPARAARDAAGQRRLPLQPVLRALPRQRRPEPHRGDGRARSSTSCSRSSRAGASPTLDLTGGAPELNPHFRRAGDARARAWACA